MANLRNIKRRIKSAKNISQITHAMELVAASRMKKAQIAAINSRPYTQKLMEAVNELITNSNISTHPLKTPKTGPRLIILFTTNKGLCGGLNTQLLKHHLSITTPDCQYISIGKKGENFIIKTGKKLLADFSSHPNASAISELVQKEFLLSNYSEVFLVYNRFISSLKQSPTIEQLLPIKLQTDSAKTIPHNHLIEPNLTAVIDNLLSSFVENQIHHALLESQASEYSARMINMKQATDSAKDFIKNLTLEYNGARQSQITSEIADLVTARMSTN